MLHIYKKGLPIYKKGFLLVGSFKLWLFVRKNISLVTKRTRLPEGLFGPRALIWSWNFETLLVKTWMMDFHEKSRLFTKNQDFSWKIMTFHEKSWLFMKTRDFSWKSWLFVKNRDFSRNIKNILFIFNKILGKIKLFPKMYMYR